MTHEDETRAYQDQADGPIASEMPDGIYLGLNEDAYHRDAALGSTNLRHLLTSPPDYWWESWMNPMRPEDTDTADRKRGRAIHKFVLEGKQAFHGRYVRRPDDEAGATAPDKSATTKASNERAKKLGKEALHGDVYDRILTMGTVITANPHISEAFVGGIPEVSIFWRHESGVRLKARHDYLKLRSITDMKSIANILKIEFKRACKREIRYRRYPIQARHYMDGRAQMAAFVEQGAVFSGGDYDKDLLKRLAESREYAFVYVFYQAKGAPLTWGTKLSPGNSLLDEGRDAIEDALDKYRTFRDQYGITPWVLAEPLEECMSEELPNAYY